MVAFAKLFGHMTKRRRVLAARHYQPRDSAIRAIADRAIPGIKRDLKATLAHLGTLLPANALQYARAGDWHGLRREIDWTHFRQIMKTPFARIGKAREEAAKLGEQKINGTFAQARRRVRFRKQIGYIDTRHGSVGHGSVPYGMVRFDGVRQSEVRETVVGKSIGDRFSFDLYDETTQARIRAAQDDLIQQIEATARDTIETVVLSGAQEGLSPDDITADIRDLIGLTDRQAQAVLNYEAMLRDLDPTALERQLRNGQYDEVLQDAIDAGDDLSETMIGQMVDDYVDNYLDYRASMIAQTESTRAASAGLQDAYSQAIDRGAIPADAVKQFWQVATDERTCEVCLSIPDQNPDGVAINEPFDSIDGQMDAPPDPHPSCRCSLEIITDLDRVPSDDTEEEAAA